MNTNVKHLLNKKAKVGFDLQGEKSNEKAFIKTY